MVEGRRRRAGRDTGNRLIADVVEENMIVPVPQRSDPKTSSGDGLGVGPNSRLCQTGDAATNWLLDSNLFLKEHIGSAFGHKSPFLGDPYKSYGTPYKQSSPARANLDI